MSSFLCTRCNKVWIEEEYDDHECTPLLTDYETFKITSFYTFTDKLKRSVLRVRSLSGKMIDMIIIPEDKASTKVPYILANHELTEENTNHEDNSTFNVKLLTCCQILFALVPLFFLAFHT